jgi:recombination protein RecT
MSNDIKKIVYSAEGLFNSVMVDKSVNFEKEANFAVQSLMANEFALGIAKNNPQSVINAVTNVGAIGISLNPAKKQAYLVPRKGAICLDISYMGLVDLATDTGSIKWAQADIVRSDDIFILNGIDKAPRHEFNPFTVDRGAIIGAYVTAKTADGDYLTDCMTIDELNNIKNRSESAKKGLGPWITDATEMMKKTVVKRAYKLWPKSERLSQAIHYLNEDSDEGIDFKNDPPKQIPKEKPDYLLESFNKNSPKWKELIESGKNTAEEIINTIESKACLSKEQKDEILGYEKKEQDNEKA